MSPAIAFKGLMKVSVLRQIAILLDHIEQVAVGDIGRRFEKLLVVGTLLRIEHGHLWFFYKNKLQIITF